jgi:hypothetical protein
LYTRKLAGVLHSQHKKQLHVKCFSLTVISLVRSWTSKKRLEEVEWFRMIQKTWTLIHEKSDNIFIRFKAYENIQLSKGNTHLTHLEKWKSTWDFFLILHVDCNVGIVGFIIRRNFWTSSEKDQPTLQQLCAELTSATLNVSQNPHRITPEFRPPYTYSEINLTDSNLHGIRAQHFPHYPECFMPFNARSHVPNRICFN